MEKIADVYTHIETENEYAWYKNGLLHREGGEPALIHKYGWGSEWFIDGVYSRPDNLPHIEHGNGALEWIYADGSSKRVYGSVEEYRNKNGHWHRDERDSDGLLLPAIVGELHPLLKKVHTYYLDGERVDRHGVPLRTEPEDYST
jgi:hypothetical protein